MATLAGKAVGATGFGLMGKIYPFGGRSRSDN
jgi:hypothetical protein